jgi:hypothetical protein
MHTVHIKRKRKPALHTQTRQLFAFGSLCTGILKMVATYGGGVEKDNYVRVQIENRRADTALKAERESYVVAQNQRLELLNAQKRLELIAKYGDKFYEAMGEPRPEDSFDTPHTV